MSLIFLMLFAVVLDDDPVPAQVAAAKAARAAAMEKADAALLEEFTNTISTLSKRIDLDTAKIVLDEQTAYQQHGKFPKSKVMGEAVRRYLKARAIANDDLAHADDSVIAEYASKVMVNEGIALQKEKAKFWGDED